MQGKYSEIQARLVSVYSYPPIRNILCGLNEEFILLNVRKVPPVPPTAGLVRSNHTL